MAFNIIRDNIVNVKADAIVNTANPKPIVGGGTDNAIYNKAGHDKLLAERQKIGDIEVGKAAITPAFGLKAKYIIHTVGPIYIDGLHHEAKDLASCYRESFKLAKKNGCKSIAFPLISTGVYGFPKDEALNIAVREANKYCHDGLDVTLVVFDSESVGFSLTIFNKIKQSVDDNYVADELNSEYKLIGSENIEDMYELEEKLVRRRRYKNVLKENSSEIDFSYIAPNATNGKSGKKERSVKTKKTKLPSKSLSTEDKLRIKASGETPYKVDLSHIDEEKIYHKLNTYIDEVTNAKKVDMTEIYKGLKISKQTYFKIRHMKKGKPNKYMTIGLALCIGLNHDQIVDLLSRGDYSFNKSEKQDYVLEMCAKWGLNEPGKINLALAQNGLWSIDTYY